MPIDTSIYSRFQPQQPDWNALNQGIANAGARFQQNKLMDLLKAGDYEGAAAIDPQRANAYQEITGKSALNKAWAGAMNPDGTINESKLVQDVAAIGQGSAIPGLQTTFANTRKAITEADKAKLEQASTQLGMRAQILGAATDPASYAAALQRLAGMGVDMSDAPQQFDPAYIARESQQALTAKERLDQMWKGKEFDYRKQNDAANRGVTIRGQNMADARAKESAGGGKPIWDATRGVFVNPQTMTAMPVTMEGGGALPAAKTTAAPTEDERKAAGWFAQADNAYRNMRSVLATNPEAAKPGFVESYSPVDEVANVSRSPARQQYVQAASSFAEAALRAATGAGVTKDEAQQKIRELTPQRGDSDAVITQKAESLKVYLDSLKTRAGRAMPEPSSGASGGWGIQRVD